MAKRNNASAPDCVSRGSPICWVILMPRGVPQRLKPGNICGGYGGAEAVPMTDCDACEGEQATANANADSLREGQQKNKGKCNDECGFPSGMTTKKARANATTNADSLRE
jgi:hypothetical protein